MDLDTDEERYRALYRSVDKKRETLSIGGEMMIYITFRFRMRCLGSKRSSLKTNNNDRQIRLDANEFALPRLPRRHEL